ncbi:MAG TPA: phosphodiesterase [Casimicrobiaceae bacterium]|jgi:3',5'-cyclic AMP phosphodiesterase CpdA|nr:phosphodiesterase [Casimicrobiaceae bacterium]
MLIAQISDLHVMPEGQLAYGRVDTATMLRNAVAHVNRLDPAPDVVLLTGDLADRGEPAAYAQMRRILGALRAPFYAIPGNHDRIAAFRDAFADQPYLPREGEFILYAVDDWPLRIVALDSVVQGRTKGLVCERRLAWLDRTLGERPDAPTIVMMHHAPWVYGLEHLDEVGMEGAAALEAVIRRHPQVERVLCGHVHRSTQIRFGGTIASSCPSTAHQQALDLRPDGIDSFSLEPPGFQLHRWAGGTLFTHTLNVGEFAGPFPFH